jgi:hypothetical protein
MFAETLLHGNTTFGLKQNGEYRGVVNALIFIEFSSIMTPSKLYF